MNFSPFISINQPCDDVLQWAKGQLSQAGLHPVQTFDLHTARLALHECPCPNHGTADCDCQMVILMVYGENPDPATLILHGNDGKTWFSIAEDPSQRVDGKLVGAIRNTLEASLIDISEEG